MTHDKCHNKCCYPSSHLRAGTTLTTLDNNGRTPLQLAQSKLKLLQRNSAQSDGMSRVMHLVFVEPFLLF